MQMSNSEYRAPPNDRARYDMQKELLGTNVTVKLLQCVIVLYRLIYCGVTDEGCAALASALRSNPSHLRELDLSVNKLGDSVKLLSDVLQDPHCKLETLR